MTNQVKSLASRLQFFTRRHTFEHLSAILAAGSPFPLTVRRSPSHGRLNVSFFDHRGPLQIFTTAGIRCFGDQIGITWQMRLTETMWPIPKSELETWLTERLNTSIPDDLLSQSKLCLRFAMAKNLTVEEGEVKHSEDLPKYRRIRNNPARFS